MKKKMSEKKTLNLQILQEELKKSVVPGVVNKIFKKFKCVYAKTLAYGHKKQGQHV